MQWIRPNFVVVTSVFKETVVQERSFGLGNWIERAGINDGCITTYFFPIPFFLKKKKNSQSNEIH